MTIHIRLLPFDSLRDHHNAPAGHNFLLFQAEKKRLRKEIKIRVKGRVTETVGWGSDQTRIVFLFSIWLQIQRRKMTPAMTFMSQFYYVLRLFSFLTITERSSPPLARCLGSPSDFHLTEWLWMPLFLSPSSQLAYSSLLASYSFLMTLNSILKLLMSVGWGERQLLTFINSRGGKSWKKGMANLEEIHGSYDYDHDDHMSEHQEWTFGIQEEGISSRRSSSSLHMAIKIGWSSSSACTPFTSSSAQQ